MTIPIAFPRMLSFLLHNFFFSGEYSINKHIRNNNNCLLSLDPIDKGAYRKENEFDNRALGLKPTSLKTLQVNTHT